MGRFWFVLFFVIKKSLQENITGSCGQDSKQCCSSPPSTSFLCLCTKQQPPMLKNLVEYPLKLHFLFVEENKTVLLHFNSMCRYSICHLWCVNGSESKNCFTFSFRATVGKCSVATREGEAEHVVQFKPHLPMKPSDALEIRNDLLVYLCFSHTHLTQTL